LVVPVAFLIVPRPPTSTLLPYTTLFRSGHPPDQLSRLVAGTVPVDVFRQPAVQRVEAALADLVGQFGVVRQRLFVELHRQDGPQDRKSTRLNSSHVKISYAVFCLKKKTM